MWFWHEDKRQHVGSWMTGLDNGRAVFCCFCSWRDEKLFGSRENKTIDFCGDFYGTIAEEKGCSFQFVEKDCVGLWFNSIKMFYVKHSIL